MASSNIRQQYEDFPYPSPPEPGKSYPELANLAQLFVLDAGYKFVGKRVLDVGTGTGLRLLELAKHFPENSYLGIDRSEAAIAIANSQKRLHDQTAVEFSVRDAAELNGDHHELFDVIFCMGVLHHLVNPHDLLHQLGRLLEPSGMLFFYVYGEFGSTERMRRKRILQHLHSDGDVVKKIASAKALGLTDFPYGWELRNQLDMDAMIVDAYINEFEVLYTLEKIDAMVPLEDFACWIPYGFTLDKYGLLVECRSDYKSRLPLKRTVPKSILTTSLIETYNLLPQNRKLLLLEDWYQPAGYTVLLQPTGSFDQVDNRQRLEHNAWLR